MPTVIFIEPDGTEFPIAVKSGDDREGCGGQTNGVPGIDGDCGGDAPARPAMSHVDAAWIDRTGMAGPGGMEDNLLQFAEGSTENSRLACQIAITDDLDGLTLRIPDGQH